MYVEQALQLFQSFYDNLKSPLKWAKLLSALKSSCTLSNDSHHLALSSFQSQLEAHNLSLSPTSSSLLLQTFPSDLSASHFVLDRLFDTRMSHKLSQAYNLVSMTDYLDAYVATDPAGYIGNFHRAATTAKSSLIPLSFK